VLGNLLYQLVASILLNGFQPGLAIGSCPFSLPVDVWHVDISDKYHVVLKSSKQIAQFYGIFLS
jgi:hypothetical protein